MNCRLCLAQRQLRNSHVLPELVYKPLYDSSHSATAISFALFMKRRIFKGLRERRLCDDCEQFFSQLKDYFGRVWLHPQASLRPDFIPGNAVVIRGLDCLKSKLFHMSLIWRASVSTLDAFQYVRLGGQEEKVRRRLLASDPGNQDIYPSSVWRFATPIRRDSTIG